MPRLVILESPYAGDVAANETYARACLRHSLLRGEAPIASHLLYTQPGVLDDTVPAERAMGIDAGLAWGRAAEAAVVYIDRGISDGMRQGIMRANQEGRSVEFRRMYLPGQNQPPAQDQTLLAWHEGQITEGLAAQLLGRPRIEARVLYDQWADAHLPARWRDGDTWSTPAHRHADTEPVQMVRYRAHPDPEIAAARLQDLRDLGATRVATRMSSALQMPSVGDALEFVHREIADYAELISAAAATNLVDEHMVLRAVAAVLADLVDDMALVAEVADART